MRHMKKLFILFLIVVLAMLCFTTVSASDETELVSYPVTGGRILFDPATGTVTGYEGAITNVDIPSKIDGVDVVAIGRRAFRFCGSLTSVNIPEGVETIGRLAFRVCESLTSIAIPASMTSFGSSVFSGCNNLKGIHFSGTEAQWERLTNGIHNYNGAILHYNAV